MAGTALLGFARRAGVGRAVGGAVRRTVGLATRLITTAIARWHATIARRHASASAAATAARVTQTAWTARARRTRATGTAWTGALIMRTAFRGWTLAGFVVGTFVGRRPFVGFVRPVEIGTALARFVRLGF